MKADWEQVWIDFRNEKQSATRLLMTFLSQLVKNTRRKRIVLGPEEVIQERAIKHATTLQNIWVDLVSVADFEVMRPQRLKEPKYASFWELSYTSKDRGLTNKPAYKFAKVRLDLTS
jgi:hypothetical protein